MADIDLKTDEEKAQELKQWWKENGLSVFAGIALAIGGMFAWQQWKIHKVNQSEGASRLYSQIKDPGKNSNEVLQQLNEDYGNTPYRALAALEVAKTTCQTDKTDECIKLLQQATNSSQEDINIIANLRLARVLISANKLDDAQSIINKKMPAAYTSLVEEIKGDLFLAKNETDKAREAYDRAILSSGGQNVEFLQMKKNDLGESQSASPEKS